MAPRRGRSTSTLDRVASRLPFAKVVSLMTPLILARLIALLATGLIAGIFLGHRAGVSRASTRLPLSSFVQLQQIIHETFQRMMPLLVVGALLGTVTWTVLARTGAVTAFSLLVVASLALVVIAGVTRAINIPINRQLEKWSSDKLPADASRIWSRWERVHSIRTALAISAFVCQVVALGIAAPGAS